MKIAKSFKNVWSVSRNMYMSLGSFCFQFSFTFIGFWAVLEVFMLTVGKYLYLPQAFDNPLFRYVAIPCGIAWFMDKKTFDDKRPYNFLRSLVIYLFRPKYTFSGKKVRFRDMTITKLPTVVRRIENTKEKGETDVSD